MAAKKRGSKLNKSETVQVRFDPILKMAAELAAARERRSLSSYIEWAVELAAKQSMVTQDEGGNPVSAWQVAYLCFHPEPGYRMEILAANYPHLLTFRERKIVQTADTLFKSDTGMMRSILKAGGPLWSDLCLYADDEISFEELAIRANRLREEVQKRMDAQP